MIWVCEGTYKYIHDQEITSTSFVIVSIQLVEPRITWVLAPYPLIPAEPTLEISIYRYVNVSHEVTLYHTYRRV